MGFYINESLNLNEINKILNYLKNFNNESTWIEVKENQIEEDKLGITISAIANSCLLEEKEYGYILIGIRDKTWEIIGTNKKFSDYFVKGNQDIELYLKTQLKPDVNIYFQDKIEIENKYLSIVKIESASHTPISYKNEVYIRVGSNNKKLRDFPELSKRLWVKSSGFNYEDKIVKKSVDIEEILKLLDYECYYKLLKKEIPNTLEKIIQDFEKEKYIKKDDQSSYNITALGGLLLANNLDDFDLKRKAIRIVVYDGVTKSKIFSQKTVEKGYASGFIDLNKYLRSKISENEIFNEN